MGRGLAAVLFDRDGTLVEDVPYNGDPARVRPVPGARAALERLRRAGIRTGVVSNQSGIARGLIRARDVLAVHRRMEELIGPIDVLRFCPHAAQARCGCRKPAPGLIHSALAELDVPPERAAMVGDIGADVAAGEAAGVSRTILVPTIRTRAAEIAAATVVAVSLGDAVRTLLADSPTTRRFDSC
jgi:HAD superfamily hydrolase (TIGR01662 family)